MHCAEVPFDDVILNCTWAFLHYNITSTVMFMSSKASFSLCLTCVFCISINIQILQM